MPTTSPAGPSAPRSARALARTELTRGILSSARGQLAQVGPAQLSVRAVARDLGMVSSAVYRYFPSRDELLTALLLLAYTELGDAAEQAESTVPRTDLPGRWSALAQSARAWSLAHPYDFGLLFGTPVPGYAAPRTTVEPAQRLPQLILRIVVDLADLAELDEPTVTPTTSALEHEALTGLREFAGADLPDGWLLRGLRAWNGLIGSITLELFGHYRGGVEDFDSYFAALSRSLYPGC